MADLETPHPAFGHPLPASGARVFRGTGFYGVGGFSIRISPRSSASPERTVNSVLLLASCMLPRCCAGTSPLGSGPET